MYNGVLRMKWIKNKEDSTRFQEEISSGAMNAHSLSVYLHGYDDNLWPNFGHMISELVVFGR